MKRKLRKETFHEYTERTRRKKMVDEGLMTKAEFSKYREEMAAIREAEYGKEVLSMPRLFELPPNLRAQQLEAIKKHKNELAAKKKAGGAS